MNTDNLLSVSLMSDTLLLDELIWGPHTKIEYDLHYQCGHTGNDHVSKQYRIIDSDGKCRFDSGRQTYPTPRDLNTASSLLPSHWLLCSLTNGTRWGERPESRWHIEIYNGETARELSTEGPTELSVRLRAAVLATRQDRKDRELSV